MKKKWLIGSLAFLGIVILLLILLPIILKPKIEALLVSSIDEQLNAKFLVDDVSISLFRDFPNASVHMENARIINTDQFDGDTLFISESAALELSLRELFRRGDGPRKIKSFEIEGALLHLEVDKEGNNNYDISREEPNPNEGGESQEAMIFDLESYEIRNSTVRYQDFTSGILFAAENITHTGSGQFSADQSELLTESNANLSLSSSGTTWIADLPIRLTAVLGIDLTTDTYTFKKNEAFLRELPLTLSGSLRFLEEGQEWKLALSTPDSEFQNLLALLPQHYSHSEMEYTASGIFQLTGEMQGLLNDERIPEFDILLLANNGFLQYQGMPKALEQIRMNMRIANETGNSDDTYIEIGNAAFKIDGDLVEMNAKIDDLLGRIGVDATAKAALDLTQLKAAYPEGSWEDLKGRVDGNLSASFNMEDIRESRYANTKASGDLVISGLEYQEEPAAPPIRVESATLEFDPNRTQISGLNGSIGSSDFRAQGVITNLLGYLFHDEVIKGNFEMSSSKLDLNEFLVDSEESNTEEDSNEEKFEIPGFLDATVKAQAQTVYYDDLELKDVSGELVIKDKGVRLENAQSDFLGGKLQLDGVLDSSQERPEFAMQLSLKDNGIAEFFEATTFFQKLAPLAQGLQGTMDSKFVINGSFENGFELDFSTLNGQAQTELKALERILGETSLIRGLQQKLNFLDSSDLDLKGLKTVLRFQDGRVEVSPFDFMYKDIGIQVRGSHTFDAAMDYAIALEVPAYYLGDEVNNLLAQLDDPELKNVPVPVNVSLTGNYDTPVIQTDLSQSVSTLTTRLVSLQKEKALARGKEEARDLLGGIFGGETDSTETDEKKPAVGEVLGDVLLGRTNKDSITESNDSVSTKTPTLQETATGILGGLLKKKKKDSVSKDSIN